MALPTQTQLRKKEAEISQKKQEEAIKKTIYQGAGITQTYESYRQVQKGPDYTEKKTYTPVTVTETDSGYIRKEYGLRYESDDKIKSVKPYVEKIYTYNKQGRKISYTGYDTKINELEEEVPYKSVEETYYLSGKKKSSVNYTPKGKYSAYEYGEDNSKIRTYNRVEGKKPSQPKVYTFTSNGKTYKTTNKDFMKQKQTEARVQKDLQNFNRALGIAQAVYKDPRVQAGMRDKPIVSNGYRFVEQVAPVTSANIQIMAGIKPEEKTSTLFGQPMTKTYATEEKYFFQPLRVRETTKDVTVPSTAYATLMGVKDKYGLPSPGVYRVTTVTPELSKSQQFYTKTSESLSKASAFVNKPFKDYVQRNKGVTITEGVALGLDKIGDQAKAIREAGPQDKVLVTRNILGKQYVREQFKDSKVRSAYQTEILARTGSSYLGSLKKDFYEKPLTTGATYVGAVALGGVGASLTKSALTSTGSKALIGITGTATLTALGATSSYAMGKRVYKDYKASATPSEKGAVLGKAGAEITPYVVGGVAGAKLQSRFFPTRTETAGQLLGRLNEVDYTTYSFEGSKKVVELKTVRNRDITIIGEQVSGKAEAVKLGQNVRTDITSQTKQELSGIYTGTRTGRFEGSSKKAFVERAILTPRGGTGVTDTMFRGKRYSILRSFDTKTGKTTVDVREFTKKGFVSVLKTTDYTKTNIKFAEILNIKSENQIGINNKGYYESLSVNLRKSPEGLIQYSKETTGIKAQATPRFTQEKEYLTIADLEKGKAVSGFVSRGSKRQETKIEFVKNVPKEKTDVIRYEDNKVLLTQEPYSRSTYASTVESKLRGTVVSEKVLMKRAREQNIARIKERTKNLLANRQGQKAISKKEYKLELQKPETKTPNVKNINVPSISYAQTKNKIIPLTIAKPISIYKSSTRPITKTINKIENKLISKQEPVVQTKNQLVSVQANKLITRQIAKQKSSQIQTPVVTTVLTPTPKIFSSRMNIPFIPVRTPPTGFITTRPPGSLPRSGGDSYGFKQKKLLRQAKKYTPSAFALGLEIKGKKPTKSEIKTGLGLRPIVI